MEQQLANLIKYKSSEMISATKLVRSSKHVFDSIENKELDKAVILRDGKPSFVLLKLEEYEKIIDRCINILDQNSISHDNLENNNFIEPLELESKSKSPSKKIKISDKKSNILEKLDKIDGVIVNDNNIIDEKYKDFWE